MRNKFILSLCILILVVMFSASSFAAEEILFAIVSSMTGDTAAEGIQTQNAVDLALSEINGSGGVNGKELKYIVGDDMGNPPQGLILAQKFSTNDDILFWLGPNSSSCCIAALPVLQKVGLPLISPCSSNPTMTHMGFNNFFRLIVNDDMLIDQLAKLAVIELGYKNIALIWENSDYGIGMRDVALRAIPELGGKVLFSETFVPNVDRDFSSQITKFKGGEVDCVLVLGIYTAGALFLKQSEALGFNAEIIGSSGCSNPKLISIAGEASEDFIAIATFDPNDKRPKQAKFIEDYANFFKGEAGVLGVGEWGAHAYDVVYLVKKAIEMGGTTREKLIEVLHSPDFEYDGVTGLNKFDEFGETSGKRTLFLTVKDGKFVAFFPTKF